MPDRLTYTSKAGEALVRVFGEYAKVNPRELPELATKQGGELAANLYLETPRANKTEIQTTVENLGSRFIRAPAAYAARVGPKAKAFFKANASKGEKKLRTARKKNIKAGNPDKVRVKIGRGSTSRQIGLRKGLTLTEEKFAAIQLRFGRRGSAKASWIAAIKKLGNKVKLAKGDAKRAEEKPESTTYFSAGTDSVELNILNTQSGIGKLNDKAHFVDKAMAKTEQNMLQYILRKKSEIAAAFKKGAQATK